MNEKKRKFEFSKLITIIGIVFWLLVNLYGMVMMVITLDLSPLVYVTGSADAVVAIIYTTYAKKARAENVIKLKKANGVKITEDDFRSEDFDIDPEESKSEKMKFEDFTF